MSRALGGSLSVADQVVALAARHVARAGRGSPLHYARELERVTLAWEAGERAAPRFEYSPPPDHSDLRRALDEVASVARAQGELGAIYAERAEELALEASLAAAVGTEALAPLARARYGGRDGYDREADDVARSWLGAGGGRVASAERASGAALRRTCDAKDPRSLVARLSVEIGARRLPVRVVVKADLAALAASAPGVVFVAEGRQIDDRATERTVLHELEGHVAPLLRAERAPFAIFRASTRGGSDDQEGYALVLEARHGFLDEGRKAELGLRHLAARAIHEGASFVDASALLVSLGAKVRDAVRIAMRAHRGGARGEGGLGRERVYIGGYLRVTRALARDGSIERVLTAGRVSVGSAATLGPYVA